MPIRGRILRRLALAVLAASAALLVPAASRGPVAGAPDQTSSVLGSTRRAAGLDRWAAGVPTPRPTNTPSPTATPAPPPPSPTAPPAPAPKRATHADAHPTAPPPRPSPSTATGAGWYDAVYARSVFDLVNRERARTGLAPLAVEPRLAASATAYARVLSDWGRLSHVGPNGSTLVTRAEAAGFPFTVLEGEVLAWGNFGWTPEAMVRAWLNSPPHRQDILGPAFSRAGIGCYATPANSVTVYCVMDLAAG
jgi:uncharacterized protein YkwD